MFFFEWLVGWCYNKLMFNCQFHRCLQLALNTSRHLWWCLLFQSEFMRHQPSSKKKRSCQLFLGNLCDLSQAAPPRPKTSILQLLSPNHPNFGTCNNNEDRKNGGYIRMNLWLQNEINGSKTKMGWGFGAVLFFSVAFGNEAIFFNLRVHSHNRSSEMLVFFTWVKWWKAMNQLEIFFYMMSLTRISIARCLD